MTVLFEDLSNDALQGFDAFDHHEKVRKFTLGESGLTGFIGVHNTNIGPALGGCRVRPYASEDEALTDVLRLSRGMTYKNALAGLPLGGGKAVVIGDPKTCKTAQMLDDLGRAVESLDGLYVTAEDSGTGEDDMVAISAQTRHVTGLPPQTLDDGSLSLGGNPSPATAVGVYHGILAAVRHRTGNASVEGMTIAVQGVGAVGLALCKLLEKDGANLIVSDVDEAGLKRAKEELRTVSVVEPNSIYAADADLFSPCAMGAIINDETIPQLKASIIAGAANNQLQTPGHDQALAERDILYVPDYVINAGGVISVGYEYFGLTGHNAYNFDLTRDSMMKHVTNIGVVVGDILETAKQKNLSPGKAADVLAEELIYKGLNPAARSSSV